MPVAKVKHIHQRGRIKLIHFTPLNLIFIFNREPTDFGNFRLVGKILKQGIKVGKRYSSLSLADGVRNAGHQVVPLYRTTCPIAESLVVAPELFD
jgi:hypothetical protein